MKKTALPSLPGLLVFQRYTVSLLAALLFLTACRKNDVSLETPGSQPSETVTAFLRSRIAAGNNYQTAKIQLFLKNLDLRSCRIIRVGSTESIIGDLTQYRNAGSKQYPHTYYKACFLLKKGKPLYCYIYTISSFFTAEQLNADIGNILTYRNSKFTGEIITNSLDDRFLFLAPFKTEGWKAQKN